MLRSNYLSYDYQQQNVVESLSPASMSERDYYLPQDPLVPLAKPLR